MEEQEYKSDFSIRLNQIVTFLGVKPYSMEKKCGLKLGVIQKAINNKTTIGAEAISKILLEYKNINSKWLLTGEGEMVLEEIAKEEKKSTQETKFDSLNSEDKKLYQQQVNDLRYIIEMQKDKILALEEKVLSLTKREESILAIGTGR